MSDNAHSPDRGGRTEPISTVKLVERCMGNFEVALLVLEKFETQLRDDLEQLERDVNECNAAAVTRVAHGLKGAAGIVGADELARLVSRIESHAKHDQFDALAIEIAALRDEVHRCAGGVLRARKDIDAIRTR